MNEFFELCDRVVGFVTVEFENKCNNMDNKICWSLNIYRHKIGATLEEDKKRCIFSDTAKEYYELSLLFAKAYVFLNEWLERNA